MSANEDFPSTIISRLSLGKFLQEKRPLINENYVFRPDRYPIIEKFDIVHDEVRFINKPLVFVRDYHLIKRDYEISTLKINFHLCWDGFADAIKLMAGFAESFSREPELLRIESPSDEDIDRVGDMAFLLSWDSTQFIDVIVFVRNNVMITIQQQNIQNVRNIALELDKSIQKLNQTDKYSESEPITFQEIKKEHGEIAKITSGSYIVFKNPDPEKRHLFFHTTKGSINSDPNNRGVYYYRAGAPSKEEVITVYQMDEGLLPKMERLTLEIIEGEDY